MIIFPVEFQYADAYFTYLTTCVYWPTLIDLLCSNNGNDISPKILGISSFSLNTIMYQGHSAQEVKINFAWNIIIINDLSLVSFYCIIISKNQKVLIIETYQTTSTSIEIYLSFCCRLILDNNIVQPISDGLCFKYLFTQTNAKCSIVLIVLLVSMSPSASTYSVQEISSTHPHIYHIYSCDKSYTLKDLLNILCFFHSLFLYK